MSCFTSLWRCPEVGLPVSRCPEKTGLPDLGGKNDHSCNPLGFASNVLFFVELPFFSKSHHINLDRNSVCQIPSPSLNFLSVSFFLLFLIPHPLFQTYRFCSRRSI